MAPLATIVLLLALGAPAPDKGIALDVDAGFAGAYRAGSWTPVRVTVRNAAKTVKGILQVEAFQGGRATAAARIPFESPRNSIKACTLHLFLSHDENEVHARLIAGGEMAAKGKGFIGPATLMGAEVFGVVGDAAFLPYPPQLAGEEAKFVRVLPMTLASLPAQWIGYDAFSAVIFARPYVPAGGPAAEALATWIKTGGRAVVSVGTQPSAMSNSLWQDLTGVKPGRTAAMDMAAVLGGGLDWRAQVAELRGPGEVLLRGNGMPIARRVRVGSGSVIVLGFSVSAKAFRDWPLMGAFWQRMLHAEPLGLKPEDIRKSNVRGTRLIMADLTRRQRAVRFGFGWVVLLMIVYVILIGPVDYYLARKRRPAARFMFPFSVLTFSAVIYAGAYATRQGANSYKHATVYDAASGSSVVRVTKYFAPYVGASKVYGITSARAGQYLCQALRDTLAPTRRPEALYGGNCELRVAAPQWTSVLLRGDAVGTITPFRAVLTVKGQSGELRIDGGLPVPLDQPALVYGPWVAWPAGLTSGKSVVVKFDKLRTKHWYDRGIMCAEPGAKNYAALRQGWGEFFSFRREHTRYKHPRQRPLFDPRLDVSRHMQEGAAYLMGTVVGELPRARVGLGSGSLGLDGREPSAVFVRYRLEVRTQDSAP